ncbi:MAG: hypothetical protein WBD22_00385 [Pyrinomonadaceae bacterium]
MITKLVTIIIIVLTVVTAYSQEKSRDRAIQELFEMETRQKSLENEILKLESRDVELAQKQGFSAIRLLPRGQYENQFVMKGGGAYYSFLRKTHEYGYGSDLQLGNSEFSVGFAGGDYGFLIDLGDVSLASVDEAHPMIQFMVDYTPPNDLPTIRIEQRKFDSFDAGGFRYERSVRAYVGHTYAVRSISFSRSDVLVAFKVHRRDIDGSMIVFWKLLKEFPKTEIRRDVPEPTQ